MRAILLASATAASLGGLRFSRASSQGDGRPRPFRTCWITAVAPATNSLRKTSSPARVILPSLVLPAVEWSLGVSPSQAAKCRPEENAPGSGVFITSAVAPIGPTPGICASRRLQALARCQAISLASIAFSLTCNCAAHASAGGVGGVPGHQLGLDRLQFDLQLRVLPTLDRKHLARQRRQALVLR